MPALLAREKQVFDAHVNKWMAEHLGQWVLIKDGEVVGFYPDLQEASSKGLELFGLQDFFLQQISPPDSINITFLGQRM